MEGALVAREQEVDAVCGLLAASGNRGVVLHGDPGVGKTALAEAVSERLASSGWGTVWLLGSRALQDIPFGVFSPLVTIDAGPELTALSLAAQAILSSSRELGLLVIIDDAQHLDNASAGALAQMTLTGRCKVLMTIRTGETMPHGLADLAADSHIRYLELAALNLGGVRAVMGNLLGGRVDSLSAQRCWEISGGNLLYLCEIVRSSLQEGRFTERSGEWQLTGALSSGRKLTDVIRARLAELSPNEVLASQVLAVGAPIELQVLESIAGAEAIDALERQRLLRVDAEGRRWVVRLDHPLHGDLIRSSATERRLSDANARVAQELSRHGLNRSGDLIRYVLHTLETKSTPDPDTLLEAARRALNRFLPEVAERFAAIAAVSGDKSAILLRAEALHRLARFDDADAALDEIDTTSPEGALFALPVLLLRIYNCFWGAGDIDRARELGGRSLPGLTVDQTKEVVFQQALIDFFNGRPADALERLAPYPPDPTDRSALSANAVASWAGPLANSGRNDEAMTLLRPFLPLMSNDSADEHPAAGLTSVDWATGIALQVGLNRGWDADLSVRAERFFESALERFDVDALTTAGACWGSALIEAGRLDEAAEVLDLAMGSVGRQDWIGMSPTVCGYRAEVAALQGDVDAARRAIELGHRVTHSGLRWFTFQLTIGQAWLDALLGAVSSAAARLRRVAGEHERRQQYSFEVILLDQLNRLNATDRTVAKRLSDLSDLVQGDRVAWAALHARLLVARDHAGLEELASRHHRDGRILRAAETLAQCAALHERAGRSGDAERLTVSSRSLAARCGAEGGPTFRAASVSSKLTPAEREVALLAARGLASGDIAAKLTISVRTVDSHLGRVYTKLGVKGRRELAPILGIEHRP